MISASVAHCITVHFRIMQILHRFLSRPHVCGGGRMRRFFRRRRRRRRRRRPRQHFTYSTISLHRLLLCSPNFISALLPLVAFYRGCFSVTLTSFSPNIGHVQVMVKVFGQGSISTSAGPRSTKLHQCLTTIGRFPPRVFFGDLDLLFPKYRSRPSYG